jgi:hypothetical protein
MDFNILDRPQPQLAMYADALRTAATVDPDGTFIAFLGFLKANQTWLAHSSLEQHGSEAQRRAAEDVTSVFAVIVKARVDRSEPALDQKMIDVLDQLVKLGYGDLVHLALSRVATTEADKRSAQSHALSAFHGQSSEPAEAAALRQLKDSLDSTTASQAVRLISASSHSVVRNRQT